MAATPHVCYVCTHFVHVHTDICVYMLTRESCAEGWDAKEPCKRDNILQKRPVISRNLLIVATVYILYMYTLIYVYMLTRGSCAEGRDGGGGESRYCVCVCVCV